MTTDQRTIKLQAEGSANRARADQRHRQTREPAWGKTYRKLLVASDSLAVTIAVVISMVLMTPSGDALVGASGVGLPYTAVAATLGIIWLLALSAGGSRNPWADPVF
ncbi:hypothetical protein [Propionibacterium freudenreichii]|uniref:hypothetical protein n=1 Tax=Propionibacterium freudenreichii TaxID=1744 RepID=UPI0021A7E768|nr:hypothetical protein [Propionibacterium freudenreichii]